MASFRWRRIRARILGVGAVALVSLVLAMAGGTLVAVGVVEHTSQPEFCNSCHIMEPYYESWKNSSHAHVGCIECHYEPGAVETFEGKFKALSQLAKYVTRTAGTKPWAEVSDQSCMRAGCHSVRMLEGPISFGRVKFDHRHHLLESRRGRRLRCVSCHSQIVQGEHVTVTESVCFMCHFMPGSDHGVSGPIDDCMVCHGPPQEPVEVAGRTFEHREYVARGVDCRECHDPVVQGEGTVRRERCHSCHGEIGHIERIGETAFLHEMHVTEHKVECFECHDEIYHGLLPLEQPQQTTSEGCGSCHVTPHDGAQLLFAGTGAAGVPDRPARMYETRVVCAACHSGRSGLARNGQRTPAGAQAPSAALDGHPFAHQGSAAAAGDVDCIHCHGTGFAGMLGRWQAAVGGRLDHLRPLLERLADALPEAADDPTRALYDDARRNVELVALDGSRGAHNVDYALDALQVSAERIEQAFELLDPALELDAAAGFPFRSAHGCSTCHLGIEQTPVVGATGQPFPHDRHLGASLDCDTCHSVEEHGQASLAREDCASCHHTENDDFDAFDCYACHTVQDAFVLGESAGFEPHPGPTAEKECSDCHGEGEDVGMPSPALCVLCHEPGFDAILGRWQEVVGGHHQRLLPLLARLERALPRAGDHPARALVREARRDVDLVAADGSRGVHNPGHALELLAAAAERIDQASALLDAGAATGAATGFPFESAHGCSTCHLGIEQVQVFTAEGRPFSHDAHLRGARLDCDTCHSVEEHMQPSLAREDCASCHHQESEGFDAYDCAACHTQQQAFSAGAVEGFEPLPGPMAEKECIDCHGEPGDIVIPPPAMCVLCHDASYGEMPAAWRGQTDALAEQVEAAHAAAVDRGLDQAWLDAALRGLRAVRADGSRGVHHFELTRTLLEESLRLLGQR